MKELVGCCSNCKKEIYCLDGFLNGVHTDAKELYCFDCYERQEKPEKNPQS
ncbi:hypothetical protein [Neobacillus dielmonensis]|uniref:hypothetical protein n=1 Tax=Neobacillus dielmonensis TaxID=1347369 RepID=UPI000AEE4D7F|nr:hypothetical protein [Neobacillus dielmonensis]